LHYSSYNYISWLGPLLVFRFLIVLYFVMLLLSGWVLVLALCGWMARVWLNGLCGVGVGGLMVPSPEKHHRGGFGARTSSWWLNLVPRRTISGCSFSSLWTGSRNKCLLARWRMAGVSATWTSFRYTSYVSQSSHFDPRHQQFHLFIDL
jgi:hypothetical protein